nr:AFG1-like ATPase isoform X3 [Physcomitrium patens]|eukprot:XP_024360156.1 AFG1-like ATPase isoform X3 [Physcomitrella patens]
MNTRYLVQLSSLARITQRSTCWGSNFGGWFCIDVGKGRGRTPGLVRESDEGCRRYWFGERSASKFSTWQGLACSGGGWLFKHFMSKSITPSPRGLYLYGGVGTGKTMLMDMFYEQLPRRWRKSRTHFHDFMLHVHSRLQRRRGMADPLEMVAGEIAEESVLLCIDEFMVTDVADALILNRLFDHLFRNGVVMVSTSNRAPDKLYEGGLQRDLFLPFIATLKKRCVIHEIGSSTDYRRLTAAETGFYFMGPGASETLRKLFLAELDGEETKPTIVEVIMGRKLKVPLAGAGCSMFQFHELCEMPLGAADFFGLFKNFHTLALDSVPIFGSHNRSSAYRFVTLVDVMYDHRTRFMCSAEGSPQELFAKVVTRADAPKKSDTRSVRHSDADLLVDDELGFAKDRTISRLTEMHSKEYLKEHAKTHKSGDSAIRET